MSRPNQTEQQRKKFLLILCQVFSEKGYRRTTTAQLASRCRVRENILYRLWPDKKAMFLAALDDVYHHRAENWAKILADHPGPQHAIAQLVAWEAKHQGEFGFYRIVFTALAEADDPDMRTALTRMYRRFHQLICHQIDHSGKRKRQGSLSTKASAWALIGLATISNIILELKMLPPRERERMFASVAQYLTQGETS